MENTFQIARLVHIAQESIHRQVQSSSALADRESPIFEGIDSEGFYAGDSLGDSVGTQTEWLGSEDDLVRRVQDIVTQPGGRPVIVLSDALVASQGKAMPEPSPLTGKIRQLLLTETAVRNGSVGGLVALLDGGSRRTTDIDRVVDARQIEDSTLRTALQKTAASLWLKTPRRSAPAWRESDAVRVQVVNSRDQLRGCLRLRHQVYDLMGYLEEPQSGDCGGIEMDRFDLTSIHFAAVDKRNAEVIGTLRIVVQDIPHFLADSVIGNPVQVMQQQADWCREINRQLGGPWDRELAKTLHLPLPILVNSDFGERWADFLKSHPPKNGGEVSRLVVAPRYQGLSVSRMLMRAGIAVAFDLRRRFLLLECIPTHVVMYKKHKFEPLDGHHCRAQGLDQVAVGMRLDLDDTPFNAAVGLARRDAQMMRHSRSAALDASAICVCGNALCWKDGQFGSHKTHSCPLH